VTKKTKNLPAQTDDRPDHIWSVMILSDIHLGRKACAAGLLYEFLLRNGTETLILNGDIIDGWAIGTKKFKPFDEMQMRVMDLIQARVKAGMKLIYIPGNHDEALRARPIMGRTILGVMFQDSLLYKDPKGRDILILHGDQFDRDIVKKNGRFLYDSFGPIYERLMALRVTGIDTAQRLLQSRFSLATYTKEHPKQADRLVSKFERAAVGAAHAIEAKGVMCGHIHEADLKEFKATLYGNSGDWVENFSALTCDASGDWALLRWGKMRKKMGLKKIPDESNPHPFAGERPTSLRQVRLIRRLWPTTDWAVHLKAQAGRHPRIP